MTARRHVPLAEPGDPAQPHRPGRFGAYGGRFVPEALVAALESSTRRAARPRSTPRSWASWTGCTAPTPAGQPAHRGAAVRRARRRRARSSSSARTSTTPARTRSTTCSARRCSTKRMGKTRVIAETGAGQHGVATATAAALLGLECVVYMGEEDTERQALNVARMRLLGAEVVPVDNGSRTLKDAINEAMRDWVTNVDDHPLPARHGHRPAPVPRDGPRLPPVIGDEARDQVLELTGRLPDAVSPASAAAATPSASSTASSTTRRCG